MLKPKNHGFRKICTYNFYPVHVSVKCQARVSAPREMDIHFLLLEEKQYSKKKATM